MNQGPDSLRRYASRRFTLSGTSKLRELYPYNTPVDELGVDRKASAPEVVSFAHYDYLGLADDPRIKSTAKDALERFGAGAGASRLVGGEVSLHRGLENEIADFLGTADALATVSGYGTNVALIGHLMTKDDLIVVDQAAHNSIMMGCQLSRSTALAFQHNDLDDLARLLSENHGAHKRVLVVVEGLYSMDGDIPDLPRLIELCRAHDAWLMVDEAHSIGVLGETGRGVSEHFGLEPSEIDIVVGTLSKSFVTCGGFIAGNRLLIDWLRCTMPGFVYSVGLAPPLAAAAREAIRILRAEPERLSKLHAKSKLFLDAARQLSLNTGNAVGAAVVPIHFQTMAETVFAAKVALDEGFFVPPIAQIAVPKDLPRLRFFLTTEHMATDMHRVLEVLTTADRTETCVPNKSGEQHRPTRTRICKTTLAKTAGQA